MAGAYNPNNTKSITVFKSGHTVYVDLFAKLSESGYAAWTTTKLCTGLPPAAGGGGMRGGVMSVDGNNTTNAFCLVNAAGELIVAARDLSLAGKNIMGGFTYISSE